MQTKQNHCNASLLLAKGFLSLLNHASQEGFFSSKFGLLPIGTGWLLGSCMEASGSGLDFFTHTKSINYTGGY
jgi:hypothetical protein